MLKDDFHWLEENYLEADGLIFVMPIFEKGTPAVFEILRDRMAGPSHDTGLLMAAKGIAAQKGTAGPDPRHFKKRFASCIGIGGSDWASHMAADFGLYAMAAPLQVVDNLVFTWSKAILGDDDKIARSREVGRAIARAVKDPANAKYLGEPGFCGHCHSRLMYFKENSTQVECAVCGIVGDVVIRDGKMAFAFPVEQLEHAHNLIPGKMKHLQDVGQNEGKLAMLKKTDLYRQRQDAYKAFLQPSRPPKV